MQPRVLYRTHYQVDEPAYMELAIKKCTSPVQSSYRDRVAERITQEIKNRNRAFNPAAGGYAVDLAYGLELLTPQNTWTGKGHLVGLIAQVGEREIAEELPLTDAEKLLHFRLFLAADGAALAFLSRKLLELGRLPPEEGSWNALAQEMFRSIYEDYLSLASTTQDRVALRQNLIRLESRGFAGKTGAHKMFVHLQTLYRLGFVELEEAGGRRSYEVAPAGRQALAALASELPTVRALEELWKRERWIELTARALVPGATSTSGEGWGPDELLILVVPYYMRVVETGTPLCPLAPLVEAVQIELLAERRLVLPSAVAVSMLQEAQRRASRDIRFHVDRTGRPAFLKLSPQLIQRLESCRVGAGI